MSDSISTLGLQLSNITNLINGQSLMSTLTQQLSTGKKSTRLADYSASDAQQILNLTDSLSQHESFVSVSRSIDPRIKVYDQSLTGIENIASQMTTTVINASTYNAGTNDSLAGQIKSAMQQVSYFLNQKVADRYVYAGSRYGTPPVIDFTTLNPPTAGEAAAISGNVASHILPSYDSQAYQAASVNVAGNSMSLQAKISGTFGNSISMTLSDGTTPGTFKATIGTPGQAYNEEYDNISGTGVDFWTNLAAAINARPSHYVTATADTGGRAPAAGDSYTLSGGTGSSANFAASATITDDITYTELNTVTRSNGITVTLADGTNAGTKMATITDGTTTETYDNIAGAGSVFWDNLATAVNSAPSDLVLATTLGGADAPVDTTYTLAGGSSPVNDPAFVQDQVAIDTAQTLQYGITSTQPGFQKLILGLRYAYVATQDPSIYTSNMDKARELITQGLVDIRSAHSDLSSASASLTQTLTLHQTLISNIQSQVGDIQNVDINEVAIKLNTFQAQLQASYAATARMTELSILKYL